MSVGGSVGNIDLRTFNDLFSDDCLYRIPNYQRGFAWQLTHVNDFWNDLINLRLGNNHYTGMITIQKLRKSNGYEKWEDDLWFLDQNNHFAFHIVDGQQRVTTFVLLINSIVQYAEKKNIGTIGSLSIQEIRSKYICRREKGMSSYVFGYEVDNPSFRYLKFRIFENDERESVEESYYTNNLAKAKDYFDKHIEDYCDSKPSHLDELFIKLTTGMQFIQYDIKAKFNVFVAFETMNNRGKRLSNLELLKNRLIYLTTLFDENTVSKYRKKSITTLINQKWSEIYKWLGRDKDKPLDDNDFLRNHWILYFGYSRNTGNEYVNFLLNKYFTSSSILGEDSSVEIEDVNTDEDLEDTSEDQDGVEEIPIGDKQSKLTPEDIEDYVKDLASVAERWYYSHYPAFNKKISLEEKDAISRLNHVGMAYFRPLVVASYINENVTTEERLKLFESIERTILLVFRMTRQMSTYRSSIFYKFSHELVTSDVGLKTVIFNLNRMFVDNLVSGMKTFREKMSTAYETEYGFYRWNSIKFLLYEYEVSLCHGDHPLRVNWDDFSASYKDKVSIEHIYPQTPVDSEWEEFSDLTDKEKYTMTNSLGNLLLLSQPKNSSLQNYPFKKKRDGFDDVPGYVKGSDSEREVAENEKWGPEEIVERGMKILSFVEKHWRITFKNRTQMYDILGVPERYRKTEEEMDSKEKMNKLKEELFEGFENVPERSGIKDIPIDAISESRLTIYGITFEDKFYEKKNIHEAVIIVLNMILSRDTSLLDPHCDIIPKRCWFPEFTRGDWNSPKYVAIEGVKIYLPGGQDDLKVLVRVAKIYGINPSSITVRVRKK